MYIAICTPTQSSRIHFPLRSSLLISNTRHQWLITRSRIPTLHLRSLTLFVWYTRFNYLCYFSGVCSVILQPSNLQWYIWVRIYTLTSPRLLHHFLYTYICGNGYCLYSVTVCSWKTYQNVGSVHILMQLPLFCLLLSSNVYHLRNHYSHKIAY